jgi:hypothetical protein
VADLAAVKIEGLREFNAALKALDKDLPKAVRLAFNAAADVVVADARPRVPRLTGAAAGSIRVASTRTAARVRAGGSKAPHYPWLDFGGSVGPNRSVQRPFLKEGRYLYNAYFRKRASGEFVDVMSKALIKVARSAGIEVTSGR